MITLHALKYSRATRVLWLLADLGQPCKRIDYDRTESFRGPDALKQIHPLGKSPVIEDDGQTIAESGAILRYLVVKYDDDSHTPPHASVAYWRHEALLDYVEGSLAGAALPVILPSFQGKSAPADARATLDKNLDYVTQMIGDGPLLFGDRAMLADIQMSYIVALLARFDLLSKHPAIMAYWEALKQQPGYIAAVKAAGPMAPPACP